MTWSAPGPATALLMTTRRPLAMSDALPPCITAVVRSAGSPRTRSEASDTKSLTVPETEYWIADTGVTVIGLSAVGDVAVATTRTRVPAANGIEVAGPAATS